MQKTAYELRISDWSSDVCSSDLALPWPPVTEAGHSAPEAWAGESCRLVDARGLYPAGTHKLDKAYLDEYRPLAEQRVRQAAYRLALVLNPALGECQSRAATTSLQNPTRRRRNGDHLWERTGCCCALLMTYLSVGLRYARTADRSALPPPAPGSPRGSPR